MTPGVSHSETATAEGQLPPSDFTPIPLETLDWEETRRRLLAIEWKLARIKLAWWRLMVG